jgi:hypothetical protein
MTDDDILELAKDAWRNGQWCFSDRGLIQFVRAIAQKDECETCAAKRKKLTEAGLLKSPMRAIEAKLREKNYG